MSKWREFLSGGAEEETEEPIVPEVEEEEEVVVPPPAPSYMTPEQVQAMMDRQAEQMGQHFNSLVTGLTNTLAPKKEAHYEMPTDDELAEAIESGNTKLYLQLQKKKDAAWASIIDQRVRTSEEMHQAQIAEMQERLAANVVPDDYRKEVTALADEYGLEASLRRNPKVLELLTNAVKGKNLEAEIAKRTEQAKRQKNLDLVPEGGNTTRSQTLQNTPQEVFSKDAFGALTHYGKDKDAFARGIGYDDFADYEKATQNLMQGDVVTHKWMKKNTNNRKR